MRAHDAARDEQEGEEMKVWFSILALIATIVIIVFVCTAPAQSPSPECKHWQSMGGKFNYCAE